MGTVFYFNGNYYKKLDCAVMTSPLGLVLVNALLCHHEMKQLRECPVAYTRFFYKRYANEVFVQLKFDNRVNNLLDLNSKHRHIRFTCKQKKMDLQRFQALMFKEVMINSKYQYIVNQHFMELISTIDPLLQLSIKVV